eukprot:9454851-Pyramimonas_sp.AAC.1
MLDLIGMVDSTRMEKNRLQVKKCQYASEAHETYFIRPSNGRSSPRIKCPEAFWANIPSLLGIELSCRADDTIKIRPT